MKRVGFVTNTQFPHLTDSDSLTIEPLRKRGVQVEPIIWSSPPPSLNQFDAIIMRSAWDYHTRYAQFSSWLTSLQQKSVRVYNTVDTMLWNSNKTYLLDLASKGVSIVPTIKIHSINDAGWKKIEKWPEIILKPTIGASSYGIIKLNTKDTGIIRSFINELLKTSSVLVQPFMKEIYEGEYSFIYFDKQFSHAILKTPKKNDFRTQNHFGATCVRVQPRQCFIDQAYEIIHHVKEPLLYARLDAIVVNNNLQLMELELIEPHLFLEDAPEKASMFADAIAQSI